MKVLHFILALSLVGAATSAFPARAADATNAAARRIELFPDPVVAKGKGLEIRRGEVDESVANFKAALVSQGQSVRDDQREPLAARILDHMVINRLVQQRATDADRQKAKELADKFIADTKARASSEESYRRQLVATGVKPEVFEARALEQAVVETVLDREIKSKLTLSDQQVRDFYDSGIDLQAREIQGVVDKLEKSDPPSTFYSDGKKRLEEVKKGNLARLEQPEQVRVNLFVIYTVDRVSHEELPENEKLEKKEVAEKLRARLKAGEDWAKLANDYSDDPEASRNHGEYTIARNAPALPELAEMKATLFTLPTNEVSELIPTKLGFYLAKVLEKTPAGKVPFAKAEKGIRELLLNQEVQKRLPDYFAQLKKEYAVEITLSPGK